MRVACISSSPAASDFGQLKVYDGEEIREGLAARDDHHRKAQSPELPVAVLLEFGGVFAGALELDEVDDAMGQEDYPVWQSSVELAQELEGQPASFFDLFPELLFQGLLAFLGTMDSRARINSYRPIYVAL